MNSVEIEDCKVSVALARPSYEKENVLVTYGLRSNAISAILARLLICLKCIRAHIREAVTGDSVSRTKFLNAWPTIENSLHGYQDILLSFAICICNSYDRDYP